MWIEEVTPECIRDLFHNYEHALEVSAKGSESGSQVGAERPTKNPVRARAGVGRESVESRKYFAQPGEAEWGC